LEQNLAYYLPEYGLARLKRGPFLFKSFIHLLTFTSKELKNGLKREGDLFE